MDRARSNKRNVLNQPLRVAQASGLRRPVHYTGAFRGNNMTSDSPTERRPQRQQPRNWTPYLLILPSLVYLALFFAWPMVQGLILAIREEGALMTLRSEATGASTVA